MTVQAAPEGHSYLFPFGEPPCTLCVCVWEGVLVS